MKNLAVFVVLGILALAGCTSNNSTNGATDRAFIGGSDAITFDFMEETPPTEVYDGGQQPFEVSIQLENNGEYDVPKDNIKVKLSGFYPADFGNPEIVKNPDEDLGKSYIDPDGEIQKGDITYVTFSGFNFGGSLAGNNQYTIRADVCYKYGTQAQADLCVLEDLTSRDEEVCSPSETKAVSASSAPVTVENFQEEVAGTRKVTFRFDIVQRGTGLVSKLGSSCSTELAEEDKVFVQVDSGLNGLSCSGLDGGDETSGYTTLYAGKRKIICTQDISGESGDFEKKVNVYLTYDYKEHKERTVLVKHTTG